MQAYARGLSVTKIVTRCKQCAYKLDILYTPNQSSNMMNKLKGQDIGSSKPTDTPKP